MNRKKQQQNIKINILKCHKCMRNFVFSTYKFGDDSEFLFFFFFWNVNENNPLNWMFEFTFAMASYMMNVIPYGCSSFANRKQNFKDNNKFSLGDKFVSLSPLRLFYFFFIWKMVMVVQGIYNIRSFCYFSFLFFLKPATKWTRLFVCPLSKW